MTQSPGHRKWPEHKVEEKPMDDPVQVLINGTVVAESSGAIELDEDRHPARIYIPRADVRMDCFEQSRKTTKCPFKGEADYFDFKSSGQSLEEVAWSYEEPFDEHQALKDMIAFHDEQPEIEVRRAR
ncbi:MAG: DUF427 domain-containing protein [Pseudohongiellaceae bacterium]